VLPAYFSHVEIRVCCLPFIHLITKNRLNFEGVKMSKAFILGFIVGVALLIIGVSAGPRIQQKNLEETKAQRELDLYQKEVVDATPTQLGVLTERQRNHSKLYSFYSGRSRKKISELIAHPEGRVLGIDFGIGLGPKLAQSETPEEYFGKLANVSNAIIRGRVIQKASQITEDDTFIFTDYDVEVIEILKDNAASPLAVGGNITFTHPGGKIVVNGIVVQVKDDHFLPLPIDNKDVVLFLKYVPETGAYQPTRDNGSFQLDGENLRPLTKAQFPPGVLRKSNLFLQTVRTIQPK
jgi:hypothetical protein